LIGNIAGESVWAGEIAPGGEQNMMIPCEVYDGPGIEPEAIVTVVRVSRPVQKFCTKG
jgi:hypothetical protein